MATFQLLLILVVLVKTKMSRSLVFLCCITIFKKTVKISMHDLLRVELHYK